MLIQMSLGNIQPISICVSFTGIRPLPPHQKKINREWVDQIDKHQMMEREIPSKKKKRMVMMARSAGTGPPSLIIPKCITQSQ